MMMPTPQIQRLGGSPTSLNMGVPAGQGGMMGGQPFQPGGFMPPGLQGKTGLGFQREGFKGRGPRGPKRFGGAPQIGRSNDMRMNPTTAVPGGVPYGNDMVARQIPQPTGWAPSATWPTWGGGGPIGPGSTAPYNPPSGGLPYWNDMVAQQQGGWVAPAIAGAQSAIQQLPLLYGNDMVARNINQQPPQQPSIYQALNQHPIYNAMSPMGSRDY